MRVAWKKPERRWQTAAGKKLALSIYEKARPRYHAISRRTLDGILGYESPAK